MNRSFLLEALLRYNYLPIQKKDRSELPHFLSTSDLTPSVATTLAAMQDRPKGQGWDSVEYQLTRFNNVVRTLNIPHPLAHARLCLCIHDNWQNLSYCAQSSHSMVKPRQHSDGRTIIMDYEKSPPKSVQLSFGKRFMVVADISNFFPSVYSHAVTWAVVGFSTAKASISAAKASKTGIWFNELDKCIRDTSRNETKGVAIGPATSNVVAELVLARLDAELAARGFQFFRYIDDYSAFCDSFELAEEFVRVLGEGLKAYKLHLNIKKTLIRPLPCSDQDEWVSQLNLALPKGEVDIYSANNFLHMAQALASQEPDGSVLKYAVKTLLARKLKAGVENGILPRIVNMAFFQPAILPQINQALSRTTSGASFAFADHLHTIARENARLRRSDGLCWALFYLNRHGVPIKNNLADAIVDSRDCLAMLLLYLSGNPAHQPKVAAFAQGMNASDFYELDRYWLLLYELFCDGRIKNPYKGSHTFQMLKSCGVRFVLPPFRAGARAVP